jgi:3-methyladenine DNA glycosylase AlkD
MTLQEAMRELESLGTEQNRKVYTRHGVDANMYGVSYADLEKLRKRIKKDHDLALELWASGNHDARILATKVADPARFDARTLDAWVKGLGNYVVTDAFCGVAGKTPHAKAKAEAWAGSPKEMISRTGWLLHASLANNDASLPDSYFEPLVETIEREIHTSKNRVRDAMVYALIGIGQRNDRLEKIVTAAAGRIGKIEVDHGETDCKTPDPVEYIRRIKTRRAARGA